MIFLKATFLFSLLNNSNLSNLSCRLCGSEDESQVHIINCPLVRGNSAVLDITRIFAGDFTTGDEEVLEVCRRVDVFNNLVNVSVDTEPSLEEEV